MDTRDQEFDVVKATITLQRATRRYLSRKRPKAKLFDIVEEFMQSPKSRPLKRRYRIWQEIIMTEKSFLEALCFMIQKYKFPLLKEGVITETEAYDLFGNIEEVKDMSKALFTRWNREVRYTTSGNGLSKIFLEFIPQMQVYVPYVTSYKHFVATYDILKRRKKFAALEKKYIEEETSGTDHLAFSDLLIQPVQRLPRYRMLFEQLGELTPEDHVEYSAIREAYQAINNFCTELNQQNAKEKKALRHSMSVFGRSMTMEMEAHRMPPSRTSSVAHMSSPIPSPSPSPSSSKKNPLSRVASVRIFKKGSDEGNGKIMSKIFKSPSRSKNEKKLTKRISKDDLMAPIERTSRKDQTHFSRHRSKSVIAFH